MDYVPPKPPEETTRKCVLIPLSLVKDFISSWRDDDSPPDGGGCQPVSPPDPISPTGGGSVATSDDRSVTSYPPVDGNLSEKGNFENSDDTTVSDDDSNPSYLFKEHTQNLEEEKEQGVQLLTDDNGGENSTEKNTTSSKKVTKTETDGCNLYIMQDTEVNPKSLPSQPKSENEVTDILEWDIVVADIDHHMERLGWDCDRGQRHIIESYGVRSRMKLSDEQLLEFLDYLKSQPTFRIGQTAIFRGVKVVIERFVNDMVILVRDLAQPKSKCFEVAKCHLRFT